MYSNKTAATKKPGTFVLYTVHAVLLNFINEMRLHFFDNSCTMFGFFPPDLQAVCTIGKVPTTRDIVIVCLSEQHLKWYHWKKELLLRLYGKQMGRTCTFFIRTYFICSMICWSVKLRDSWLLRRIGRVEHVLFRGILLFWHSRGQKKHLTFNMKLWLSSLFFRVWEAPSCFNVRTGWETPSA